jgi:hypothetical protein
MDIKRLKHVLDNMDSEDDAESEALRNAHKKNKNRLIITNGSLIGGPRGNAKNPGDVKDHYVTKEEFTEFKTQITSRFDNLLKGYGKLEGKFDAFNQVWRQELSDIKSEFEDIKTDLVGINDKIDINSVSMSEGFTKLELAIQKLTIQNSNS